MALASRTSPDLTVRTLSTSVVFYLTGSADVMEMSRLYAVHDHVASGNAER
jgi:hypothetical protein